ncbi:MAG: class I SAM-dependent methyltransferase [Chloroflexi bacterium]|jgi:2-polyprenyl-3-methyl-5-hydroxy-6-metoxy-1,4-benzoquinol methylase|nr:class I SAM-dependent methyltransferase [Chloroflexota bacterium]
MDDSRDIIRNFYDQNSQQEWDRLDRHPFEFAITTRMMDRYIKAGDSILDIGGGPGRYSLHYLEKGNPVTLTDLSQGNIDFAMRLASERELPLRSLACDALLIQEYVEDKFDHVFLMGPLYHLLDEAERIQAVKSAMAMLKPNGILYASFLLMFSGIIYFLREAPEQVVQPSEQVWLDAVRQQISWGGNAFTRAFFIDQDKVLPFMQQFDLEILHLFGQEGITSTHNYDLQMQPEEIQNAWINLSVDMCEIPKYLSHSEHAMVVARKLLPTQSSNQC